MSKKQKWIIGLIFFAGIATGILFTANFNALPHQGVNAAANPAYEQPLLPEPAPVVQQQTKYVDFTGVVKDIVPAVVLITVRKEVKSSGHPDLFEEFFGRRRSRQSDRRIYTGMGSGFFISQDGYILTNNHVVENAIEISVTLPDKRIFGDATIIGTDPLTDVALLKIDESDLPYLELGDSEKLQVGEWVLAVGTPMSAMLSSTVTAGIVSAVGRNLRMISAGEEVYEENGQLIRTSRSVENFIQTDAAINRGNSGGPLINSKGLVVGINTAIMSQTGVNQGYGFSIPSNLARSVANELRKYGKMNRGYLGININEIMTYDQIKDLGLPNGNGALVTGINEESGAEAAGIEENDVIVEIDGKLIERPNQLQAYLVDKHPGTTVNVKVLRSGKEKYFNVELQGQDDPEPIMVDNMSENPKTLGLKVDDLEEYNISRRVKRRYGGVIVTDVELNSYADSKGLSEGDIIYKIGDTRIRSKQDYTRSIKRLKKGQATVFSIYRSGRTYLLTMRIP